MLQRISGTAWETKKQLTAHRALLAEAKRRDHRVLGKRLGLFSIQEQAVRATSATARPARSRTPQLLCPSGCGDRWLADICGC